MRAEPLPYRFADLETRDEAFARVLREAERAAGSEAGILITGETGTGKELLSRAIHASSRRSRGPWVAVDCASLPSGTATSELFGHRRGAFSGADRDRIGRFEAAHGGTLFLDGVDELDLESQTRLLRAIEEGEVLPLGEASPRRSDFRLLASAGPALEEAVRRERFRRDLYYRIKVVQLELPPLRDRRGDLPHLAGAFLRECARRAEKGVEEISPRALEALLAFDWPGNVRELASVIEAAVASARGERIEASDLPVHVRVPQARAAVATGFCQPAAEEMDPVAGGSATLQGFQARVEEFQRSILLEALGRARWSHREAAGELGLERHQLKYLCAKLGIRRSALGPGRSES